MFCWLVPWTYRMFQTLWLDYNHNRRVIGTRVVWNNPSTHHACFVFVFWKRIETEDLDQAIAEVTGTFDGEEEIRVELREDTNYIQRIDRLWKITAVPVTTWHMQCVKKGVGRQHTTFTSCQNAACSNEFFLQRVDYDWGNVHYFCVCFLLIDRDTHYWFSAVYFWSTWFPLWCESRTFSLTSLET